MVLFILLGMAVSGCTDGVTPRLTDLRLDGQAPDVSSVLLFSFAFEDDDGDLGAGTLETHFNGQRTVLPPLELGPLFLASDTSLTSTAGDVAFEVELSPGDDGAWPAAGDALRFGVVVVDEADHASALREVDLVFR